MQKRITKNLTLKILAFLIAVFLWLIVVNIDDPVDDKTFSNIPVQVTHEEVIQIIIIRIRLLIIHMK